LGFDVGAFAAGARRGGGTLVAWAKQLGPSEAESLLQETLVAGENTDELFSELAEDAINPATTAAT
jgi:ferritin-like metal-binding protein YciE